MQFQGRCALATPVTALRGLAMLERGYALLSPKAPIWEDTKGVAMVATSMRHTFEQVGEGMMVSRANTCLRTHLNIACLHTIGDSRQLSTIISGFCSA